MMWQLSESIMSKKGRVSGRRQKRISATSNTGEAGVQATARHNTGTEETFVAVHSRCIAMSMAYPLNGLIHPTIFSTHAIVKYLIHTPVSIGLLRSGKTPRKPPLIMPLMPEGTGMSGSGAHCLGLAEK